MASPGMDDLRSLCRKILGAASRSYSALGADGCVVGVAIFSRGWGSTVWSDTHLTYMTSVALTTEFALDGAASDDVDGHAGQGYCRTS